MATTTAQDPLRAVTDLVEQVRSDCRDQDTTRHVPASIVDALREAGIFHLLAPRDLGGGEVDPLTFFDIVETASYADGSVGWCVMIGGGYSQFGGALPVKAAREIYGNPETITAGAFRPDGVAHEVDGGYRVTGRWPLGSGSSHAGWFLGGCIIFRDGEPVIEPTGAPRMRQLFFPADETEVIDTWDATGLRGTASHDYAVHEVFVPAERGFWFQEPPYRSERLYHMPPVGMFAPFIAAVPVGVARHAIDEFVDLAEGKTPVLSSSSLADKPVAQDRLGRALGLVASARGFLRDTLGDLWQRVDAGHEPTLADRGALWLAATHAARSALEAVEIVYTTAGASSVYARSPLDRCLRDVRTAVQHICTQENNFELAGKQRLDRLELPYIWAMDYRGEG